ncbi:hypothetical protein [Nocardia sp. NPDC059239]|uniref:hypothetical protein n=1 Tax=Nocardia sp. NPDC059239 TaxID=3346785 RepID=UPI003675CDA5
MGRRRRPPPPGHDLLEPRQHRRVYSRTLTDAGVARWNSGDPGAAVDLWQHAIPILASLNSTRADAALNEIRARAPELLAA